MLTRQIFGITLALAFIFGISYVHAWVGPTVAPPNGNVSAPVNVGTSAQVKNGGLSVDALSVFGAAYVQGNMGVGVATPVSLLQVGSGGYFQFSRSSSGAPVASDCDSDAERGRLVTDTTNFRLYVCMGAARGWDYLPLTN